MGTNFYARIIPTKKRKEELKKMIDDNDFNAVKKAVNTMYETFEPQETTDEPTGVLHLGKRSAGWKFLWNPNVYLIRQGYCVREKNDGGGETVKWIDKPYTAYYVYPLTQAGIKAFIDRDDVEIYDEYNEKQDKNEFFNMAVNWTTWKGEEAWDSKTYAEWERSKNPNYREYPSSGAYIDLLKSEGFEMISTSNHDFYSDGLRFATNTEFC